MLIRGQHVKVAKAYSKGVMCWLVTDQQLIQELEQFLVKDIRDACVRDNNPRAKPKSSDTKRALIYKFVFAYVLCCGIHAIMVACEECSWPDLTGLSWYR